MTPLPVVPPGDWFGIFGDAGHRAAAAAEKARVAGLWELVDDGAGFDEVLDALISRRAARAARRSCWSATTAARPRSSSAAPREAEFTTADGPVTVEGLAGTTWAERSLTGVQHDAHRGGRRRRRARDLAIGDGLVRDLAHRPAGDAADRAEPDDGEPTDEPESRRRRRRPSPEPRCPSPSPEPCVRRAPLEPEPGRPAQPGAESPRAAPPVTRREPPTASHDGLTQAGNWDPDELARSQPGIPGPAAGARRARAPVARLTFSSGEVVDVDRAVIVGRAPEARRFTSTEQPRLVTVPSPNQEISSTHLEIRPGAGADHGSAVVTDLGSTNGTVLVQPGLPPEDLQPGIAVQLIPGAIIDLGDGVTIQVATV